MKESILPLLDAFTFTNNNITIGKKMFKTKEILSLLIEKETILETSKFLGVNRKSLERALNTYIPELSQVKGQKAKFRIFQLFKIKDCISCKKLLSYDNFSIDNGQRSKLSTKCRDCQSMHRKDYRINNYRAVREYENKYRKKETSKALRAKEESNRRATKFGATPIWYSELDDFILEELYFQAKRLENSFGIAYHIDHIIPLQSNIVCGLHWHKNWQLLSSYDNLAKGNKLLEEHING